MAKYYRLPFPNPDLRDGFHSMLPPRTHPHRGVDFPQAHGAKIRAIADGTVALVEHSEELGWVCVIKHTRTAVDRLRGRKAVYSGYCHQDSYPRVHVGDTVQIGDHVGYVGVQGRSGTAATGPHLHLTMSHDVQGVFEGEVFDPIAFIARYLEPAPKSDPRRATASRFVTVNAGDTLTIIALRNDTSVERLVSLNRLKDRDHIEAGQRLRVA